jgi:hypothetical protein
MPGVGASGRRRREHVVRLRAYQRLRAGVKVGRMDYDEYVNPAHRAAQLVEAGEHEQTLLA